MALFLKKKKQPRKTWVTLLKECLNCKNPVEAKIWLEREALCLKRVHKGYKLSGTKYLIKMNLSALLRHYDSDTERKLARLIGVSRNMFGGVGYVANDKS